MWTSLVHLVQQLLTLISPLWALLVAVVGRLSARTRPGEMSDTVAKSADISQELGRDEAHLLAEEPADDTPLGLSRQGGVSGALASAPSGFGRSAAAAAAAPHLRPLRPVRYANATLLHEDRDESLSQERPLRPEQSFRLRLDIGKLSKESQVSRPRAFPDDKLPDIDIPLDVMVSSTDFVVAASDGKAPARVAYGRFIVPRDGGRARNPDATTSGDKYLFFRMTAPQRNGPARGRIGYYYRNVLVQSQLLRADVGTGEGFSIETDYTMSRNFSAGLADMPERPRISVLTNDNGNGTHQIVLRAASASSADTSEGKTFAINKKAVGDAIGRIRAALSDRPPGDKDRSKDDFIRDLKAIAPAAYDLYDRVPGQAPQFFIPLWKRPGDFAIQVTRPTSSGFAFPWALIYDIPLPDPDPQLCAVVKEWDGKSDLFDPDRFEKAGRRCPHGPHDRNVLCPFGFWGFRYAIDQLSHGDTHVYTISAPQSWEMVMAESLAIDATLLSGHAANLRAMLSRTPTGAMLTEAKSKQEIELRLGKDLPLVYFYCHGEHLRPSDPDTWLGVGRKEEITAMEFRGWITTWAKKGIAVWDQVRPLVFINACHSLAIYPETLVSYLDAFVGAAHAAGVIGTEVKVAQKLAAAVAEAFFARLLAGDSVEHALHAIRLDYLKRGNLFGLVYTPYCWSELKFVH